MRTRSLAALAALGTLWGCGSSRANARVGVTLPADGSAELRDLRGAMQHVADSLGLTLEIRDDARDAAGQTANVGDFLAHRVSAIVIVPTAPTGFAATIDRAMQQRVPVFTALRQTDGDAVVSRIAPDDREGGELISAYLVRRLQGGNVAVLDQPDVPGVRDRIAGLRLGLARSPNIRVVATPTVEPGSPEVARQRTATLLAADQRIDAVVAVTGDLALGALAAVRAAGKPDVLVVAYGDGEGVRDSIKAGTPLVADVEPDAATVGRYAIEVVASHLRGNHVMSSVAVRVRLVDRDSL
ncbi:MAG TPA: sugar ABC transporter substrate-binding protein [Gemmatimonadales bacterium]|nr:sugar ABC transporter substrate-binding protein [Gemmatimonadales bacterium]